MFIETAALFLVAPEERDGYDLNLAPLELVLSLERTFSINIRLLTELTAALFASWFHVSRVCSNRMYPALIMFVMISSTNDIAAA